MSVSLAASPALAFGLGVTSPPPPELNSEGNSYIQGLLAKTEANKEIRKVEMESSNCLKQSRLGIGDCAGLPESELRAAIELSKAKGGGADGGGGGGGGDGGDGGGRSGRGGGQGAGRLERNRPRIG